MSLVSFFCPSCGQAISIDAPAGTQARCGLCQAVILVPSPASAPAGDAPPRMPAAQVAAPPPRTGLATASLVCGILGLVTACFPIIGFVGLILGIVALVQVRRNPDLYGGKGTAIGGVTIGAASIVLLFPLFLLFAIPAMMQLKANTQRISCSANLGKISLALTHYATDNGDLYPPDFATVVEAGTLWPYVFICPAKSDDDDFAPRMMANIGPGNQVDEGELRRCYEYLEGQTLGANADNVLVVELPHCHDDGGHVVFADGRVEFIEPYERVEQLVNQTRARIARDAQPPATRPVQP